MRYGRTIATALLGVTLTALAWATPAGAAVAPDGTSARGEHCNIVLRKLQPGRSVSEVVAKDCDTDAAALAERAPQGQILLSTVFQHSGWKGLSVNIFGYDGPCDSAGYTFDTTSHNTAVEGISSYFVYNNCWYTVITNNAGAVDGNCWDIPYVGDAHNDQVRKLHLRDGYWCNV
ncbi:hypothetical protein [Phytohabitans houttuyneae]|uniref:Secreted protein n=1 Tax=Phytohabitans houttuyneae TaxID=1076126 RepID=A0A6V8KUH6_9ACTN|nr:hypothetical protein [Phytohabitans houttuyneae]GFJ86358.1 hypothetical protein Phou_105380 [Phytohabitans houttuyneae]